MNRSAAEMRLRFIIRDFEIDGLEANGIFLGQVCDTVQLSEPRAKITCNIRPQYRNMLYCLQSDMTPLEIAIKA